MADVESIEADATYSAESAVVEMPRMGISPSELLLRFTKVSLPVQNAQGTVVAKVEIAECKKCHALLRRIPGQLAAHAQEHLRQR